MKKNEPLLLKCDAVAQQLGISKALAYRWMQDGKLPTVRVNGSRSVRVPRAALVEWIERHTQSAAA